MFYSATVRCQDVGLTLAGLSIVVVQGKIQGRKYFKWKQMKKYNFIYLLGAVPTQGEIGEMGETMEATGGMVGTMGAIGEMVGAMEIITTTNQGLVQITMEGRKEVRNKPQEVAVGVETMEAAAVVGHLETIMEDGTMEDKDLTLDTTITMDMEDASETVSVRDL